MHNPFFISLSISGVFGDDCAEYAADENSRYDIALIVILAIIFLMLIAVPIAVIPVAAVRSRACSRNRCRRIAQRAAQESRERKDTDTFFSFAANLIQHDKHFLIII